MGGDGLELPAIGNDDGCLRAVVSVNGSALHLAHNVQALHNLHTSTGRNPPYVRAAESMHGRVKVEGAGGGCSGGRVCSGMDECVKVEG